MSKGPEGGEEMKDGQRVRKEYGSSYNNASRFEQNFENDFIEVKEKTREFKPRNTD